MNGIKYVTVDGNEYVRLQTLAEALGICTASLYGWRKAGHIDFCWPLGRALTFVSRETAERLLRLRITDSMGAFAQSVGN
jgi:predicted site-specific integrase-resolvase